MELEIKVKVTKEAYELGQGVFLFIKHMKAALADGWQPGKDIPVVLQAALADLVPAMQGVDQLGAEKDANKTAFVNAFVQSAFDIMKLF